MRGRGSRNTREGGAVIFETRQVGQVLKCTAIDEATALEVSVFGPVGTAAFELQRLALRKLQWVLSRSGDQAGAEAPDPSLR
ncbi:MAG: serine hydroxymethyltransferase [Hyphomicrobiaceae bacterium]|nr:serine hydroxymethyltransferase [Hyphomicrobiaceae bacterium]